MAGIRHVSFSSEWTAGIWSAMATTTKSEVQKY